MRIEESSGLLSSKKRRFMVASTAVLGAAMVGTPLSCRTNQPGEISVKYDIFSGTSNRTLW